MWNCNNPYSDRAENLRKLGFTSYKQYLQSDLWAAIRKRAIKAAHGKCHRCKSSKVVQVHHRAYDLATLAGGNIDSLLVVCRACHHEAEQPSKPRDPYDRLRESSELLMTTKPDWRVAEQQWCEKYKQSFAELHRIRRRATSGRFICVACGRPLDKPTSPDKIMRGQYPFCVHHAYRRISITMKALEVTRAFVRGSTPRNGPTMSSGSQASSSPVDVS